MSVLERLSSADLQDLIGDETLRRLELVLPAVDPEVGGPDQLYSKANLSKLAASFSFPHALSNQRFVASLLRYLDDDTVRSTLRLAGISPDGMTREEIESRITHGLAKRKVVKALVASCEFPPEYVPQPTASVASQSEISRRRIPTEH